MSKVSICPKEGPAKWEDALGLVERSRKDQASGKCRRLLSASGTCPATTEAERRPFANGVGGTVTI